MVQSAIVAQVLLFIHTPVEILEGNLPSCGDGRLNAVHVVVDTLIHMLDATADRHLTLELTR